MAAVVSFSGAVLCVFVFVGFSICPFWEQKRGAPSRKRKQTNQKKKKCGKPLRTLHVSEGRGGLKKGRGGPGDDDLEKILKIITHIYNTTTSPGKYI